MRVALRPVLLASLLLAAVPGCLSWTSGWKTAASPALAGPVDPDTLRRAAREADGRADSRRGVESLVSAWTAVLRAAPDDCEALVGLASAQALLGAGYARTVGEQGELYRKSLQAAERALALDPSFRARVEQGAEVWEALDAVGADRADALGLWASVVLDYWRDGLSGVVQSTNRKWVRRAAAAAARLQALDSAREGNLASFLAARTVLSLPDDEAGGPSVAALRLKETVDLSPGWIRNRWGRARFHAIAAADRTSFRADLEWVVAQDPHAAPGSYGWNALYQREARDLLKREESLF
jgi:hypothetical protein